MDHDDGFEWVDFNHKLGCDVNDVSVSDDDTVDLVGGEKQMTCHILMYGVIRPRGDGKFHLLKLVLMS